MKTKVPAILQDMSAGKLADLLLSLRTERLAIESEAETIKTEESRIKNFLIETMPKSDLSRITGAIANASLVRKIIPAVKDWVELYKFIEANDAFDLIQKRVSSPAFKERWDVGIEIPGTEQLVVLDISVTKKGR